MSALLVCLPLAPMHLLWASPKMLWHGHELTEKLFWGGFRSKRNWPGGVRPHFPKKNVYYDHSNHFLTLITRLPISFVTCNKKHSKEKSLFYLKPSIPQKCYFQRSLPFFRLSHMYFHPKTSKVLKTACSNFNKLLSFFSFLTNTSDRELSFYTHELNRIRAIF